MSSLEPFFRKFEILAKGSNAVSFSEFMRMALYDEEVGYYGAGKAAIGREGDFVTSVSTGSCFGQLLAVQAFEVWERCGRPSQFSIVEQGANSGQLAADISDFAKRRWPEFANSIRYTEVEIAPCGSNQDSSRVQELSKAHLSTTECGMFFCNELLDAFPVARIRWNLEQGAWEEVFVEINAEGRLVATRRAIPINSDLAGLVAARVPDAPYSDGYTTEVSPDLERWATQVGELFQMGMVLIIDYGFFQDDFYHLDRTDGTLQCYRQHRKDIDCLDFPGDCDISAHIDWSATQAAFAGSGMLYSGFSSQGAFLTRLSEPLLLEMEGSGEIRRKWIRQFQTLTHPGQMGTSFGAMAFTKGLASEGWKAFSVK